MIKCDVPNLSQEKLCDSINDLGDDNKNRIIENSNNYEYDIFQLDNLYKEEQNYVKVHENFKEHMKKMYSQRFTSKSISYEQTYKFRKNILESSHKCSFCGISSRLYDLDHFLPKSVYPTYAITIKNLVPICKDCNTLKGDRHKHGKDEKKYGEFLHPYFDKLLDDVKIFIKCKIIEDNNSIGFNFYTEKPAKINDKEYNRIYEHFTILHLNDIYTSKFTISFETRIDLIFSGYKILNPKENKIDTEYIKTLLSIDCTNIWEEIGFETLKNNDWFLNECCQIKYKEYCQK